MKGEKIMWEDIIMLAIGNGLWAVLSCLLLAYLLKDSKKREAKFTQLIQDLSDRLKVVSQIHDGVKALGGRLDVLAATTAAKAVAVQNAPILVTHPRSRGRANKAVAVGE